MPTWICYPGSASYDGSCRLGRLRAFINDTPVSLTTLRDVAMRLVDIHSQHQNLLISEASYQLRIIDSLAGMPGFWMNTGRPTTLTARL